MTDYVCDVCGWTMNDDQVLKNTDAHSLMAIHLRRCHVQVAYFNDYETDTVHFHLVLPSKEDVEREKRRRE